MIKETDFFPQCIKENLLGLFDYEKLETGIRSIS